LFGFLAIQAEQKLIEFADVLQDIFDFTVMLQSLADWRNLIWAETHLPGLAAGIADVKNPERVPSPRAHLGQPVE